MKAYSTKEQSAEDLTTYWGRLRYFQNIINPFNAFYSEAKLQEFIKILDEFESNPSQNKRSNEELWRIRYIVDSNIHPQTKQPINILFRTSTFVPTNIPLTIALGILPPTPFNQICAQSANQTYNFMFNYCNRNASNEFSYTQLGVSYFGAVSSAVIGSVGTSKLFQKLNAPSLVIRACPLLGVWIANTFNLYFARMQDFKKGIEVFDDETDEKLPGLSQEAANIAFYKTLATRYILPMPIFIPPIAIHYMKKANIYPKNRGLGWIVDLTLAGLAMYGGLSIGIGIFPQYLKILKFKEFKRQSRQNNNIQQRSLNNYDQILLFKYLKIKLLRPYQHPSKPLTQDIEIHEPKKPERFLTEQYERPKSLFMDQDQLLNTEELSQRVAEQILQKKDSQAFPIQEQRYLSVSIIGAPNAGKSTFLNYVVGEPVSAVSNKSNTTNQALYGVLTENQYQIEFVDTPGFYSRYKFQKGFTTKAWDIINQTNISMIMVDAVKTVDNNMKNAINRLNAIKVNYKELEFLQRQMNSGNYGEPPQFEEENDPVKKILVLNKMDVCFNKRKLKWIIAEMEDLTRFDQTFYISSITGYGIPELKQYLFDQSLKCQWKYESAIKNVNTPVDQIYQLCKSAVFKRYFEEVPFIIGIEIKEFRVTNKDNALVVVHLNVQTDSQLKLVIGDQGRNIKWLKEEIQIQMVKVFKKLFNIQINVSQKFGDKQLEFDQEIEDLKQHTIESGKIDNVDRKNNLWSYDYHLLKNLFSIQLLQVSYLDIGKLVDNITVL
ncbi:hypothetical protein pb186bvf_020406 [Paramecium bursaria]